MKEVTKDYQEKLDQMIIEQYDKEYSMEGDRFDQETGTKTNGYWDHEKLTDWHASLDKVLKKRLERKK